MRLTKHDIANVRETAAELWSGHNRGEDDSTSETVMLSSGYAEVSIDADNPDEISVTQHGETINVSADDTYQTFSKGDRLNVGPCGTVHTDRGYGTSEDWIKVVCTVTAAEDGCAGTWDVWDVLTDDGETRSIYGFQVRGVEPVEAEQ